MHVHFVGEVDDGVSVSSHHARALFEVGCDVSFAGPQGPRRDELAGVDAVHLVTREQRNTQMFRRLVAARLRGIPMARFWTGDDVLWALHHGETRSIGVALQELGVVQRCRSEGLVSSLASIGIQAAVGPVVDPNLSDRSQPQPFPAQLTGLCYLPSSRRRFYGGELIDQLIRALPDFRVLVLGDPKTDYSGAKNVESLGFVDNVARAILRSTVVLQPRLDGALSRLALEALSHGRHVVGSGVWPHCRCANTVGEYVHHLRELRHESFNLEGREYVCARYDRRPSVSALWDLFRRLTGQSPLKRGVLGGWLTVAAILRSPSLWTAKEFVLPDENEQTCTDAAFRALILGGARGEQACEVAT